MQEILEKRRNLFKEFSEIRKELNAAYKDYKPTRIQLRGNNECFLSVLPFSVSMCRAEIKPGIFEVFSGIGFCCSINASSSNFSGIAFH